jgi:hypothetical protein
MTPDFYQFCKTLGIDITKQSKAVDAQIIVLEAIYDLMIDGRDDNKK